MSAWAAATAAAAAGMIWYMVLMDSSCLKNPWTLAFCGGAISPHHDDGWAAMQIQYYIPHRSWSTFAFCTPSVLTSFLSDFVSVGLMTKICCEYIYKWCLIIFDDFRPPYLLCLTMFFSLGVLFALRSKQWKNWMIQDLLNSYWFDFFSVSLITIIWSRYIIWT